MQVVWRPWLNRSEYNVENNTKFFNTNEMSLSTNAKWIIRTWVQSILGWVQRVIRLWDDCTWTHTVTRAHDTRCSDFLSSHQLHSTTATPEGQCSKNYWVTWRNLSVYSRCHQIVLTLATSYTQEKPTVLKNVFTPKICTKFSNHQQQNTCMEPGFH